MCGIAGFLDPTLAADAAPSLLRRMTDALRHRGPDAEGQWQDTTLGLALGHRRLSIVDLSPAGAQPMLSASGRYVVVFNGEIYNFAAIRTELEAARRAPAWRGHSDTEVLLAACDAWGVEATLPRLNGMFAIAVFDRSARCLHLVRDRLGEKPLYWCTDGDTRLAFASELHSLRRGPIGTGEVDTAALRDYLQRGYVHAPRTILRGVAKVTPGEHVRITLGADGRFTVQRGRYWSAFDAARAGLAAPRALEDHEALERLRTLLDDSVRLRMVADVPLGAFLSGGIDSSLVVATMQRLSSRPVRTFTIGFGEARYDEAAHARAVAAHLGTEHTDLTATPQDALDLIPQLPGMLDEPMADSSLIPTFLVSRLARQHVTVSLSGDGGDELFGGYARYALTERIARQQAQLPHWLRKFAAAGMRATPTRAWDTLGRVLPARITAHRMGDRVHKLADRLVLDDEPSLYASLSSWWQVPDEVLSPDVRAHLPPAAAHRFALSSSAATLAERMMAEDLTHYLPGDILAKVDRASMAVSLEARVPLLDHHLVEFAWQLPMHMKVRDGRGKWLLRTLLHEYVPAALVERPKQGFTVPVEHWLRGELRDWAQDLLSPAALAQHGLLDARVVGTYLREHLEGRRAWTPQLWSVLMFQAWHAGMRATD